MQVDFLFKSVFIALLLSLFLAVPTSALDDRFDCQCNLFLYNENQIVDGRHDYNDRSCAQYNVRFPIGSDAEASDVDGLFQSALATNRIWSAANPDASFPKLSETTCTNNGGAGAAGTYAVQAYAATRDDCRRLSMNYEGYDTDVDGDGTIDHPTDIVGKYVSDGETRYFASFDSCRLVAKAGELEDLKADSNACFCKMDFIGNDATGNRHNCLGESHRTTVIQMGTSFNLGGTVRKKLEQVDSAGKPVINPETCNVLDGRTDFGDDVLQRLIQQAVSPITINDADGCRKFPDLADDEGNILSAGYVEVQPGTGLGGYVQLSDCSPEKVDTSGGGPSLPEPPVVKLQNPLNTTDLNVLIGRVVQGALGFMGSVALLAFVIGGFMWLTSAGSPEQVKKGSQTMLWAAIGMFIILASYAILGTLLEGLTR